jgi:hypothetical protein
MVRVGMMRRAACVTVLVVAAVAGCEKKPAALGDGASSMPTRAARSGDFPENPLLAYAPADSPYVLATFKPVPAELFQKLIKMFSPAWHQVAGKLGPDGTDARDKKIADDLLAVLDRLDVKTIEDQGFSTKARFVIYGLGAYPVWRAELLDGAKVNNLVTLAALRWDVKLPPATDHAGGRYWIFEPGPEAAIFVGVFAKEVVLAIAPKDQLTANLANLTGDQKAATPLTTAQLKAVAERDGFTGQGVGYVDLVRVAAMLPQRSPECGAAVVALAKRMPRIAFGYDDLTPTRMAGGMVAELAPDVLGDARSMTGKLAGVDRLLASKPMMAFAVSLDLEHARTAVGRVAGVFADLGQRCDLATMSDAATKAGAALAKPLPPFLAGVHGGYAVVKNFRMTQGKPDLMEGFASIQADHAPELVKLAQAKLPGFELPADGKAHALPANASPIPGHVASSEHAIGVALGPTSEADAVAALGGKAAPAPLLAIAFDYSRMSAFLPDMNSGPETAMIRDVISHFGVLAAQLLIDDRGFVWWGSFDLK